MTARNRFLSGHPSGHRTLLISFMLLTVIFPEAAARKTQTVYLSGTGYDDAVPWEFFCSAGRKSGVWTTIEVPSCWEQQGFGSYNYGHDPFDERLKEEGHYRVTFDAAGMWRGQHVELVFEGVMTDCRVLVNGRQAGKVHRGAFYRFSYDISGLLNYGGKNTLEVFVKKFSEDMSVNHAERKADYWIFGGIFRPVYLEIKPPEHIRRVAVDARADGSFRADIHFTSREKAKRIRVELQDSRGERKAVFETVLGNENPGRIEGSLADPVPWTPEFPHLYRALFTLMDAGGEEIHLLTEKVGFRTVEVRAQDGIYVNGTRIKLKGVNRHTFHPDHGRTSSRRLSYEVVNLLKDMNMNAVRMSHYPPDNHFLDACDSLGLFVLDELAGWQRPPYDSATGRRLLGEMIARDVNHPSIIMWDNGNEGGWNTSYDDAFGELDIQQREVTHPWQSFRKTNTAHYITYDYLSMDHFEPRQVFFPTEMIHGLYDGGHGAGLEDFWLRMWDHPLCAGGFLWVFADEAVRRTDTGELDSDGNHAPDGIVGPYHEKEGSFFAIREIWSPVHMEKRYVTPSFNGEFRLQNRFHFTTLGQCSFRYSWEQLPGPGEPAMDQRGGSPAQRMEAGTPRVDNLEPGQWGTLSVPLPEEWTEADVLYLEAHDPHGRLIHRWSWPVGSPRETTRELTAGGSRPTVRVKVTESPGVIGLTSGGVTVRISKEDATLLDVTAGEKSIPLTTGPVLAEKELSLSELSHYHREGSYHVKAEFAHGEKLEWIMDPGGLVRLHLRYRPPSGLVPYTGISFSYPETEIRKVRFMGNGPYRVWKNRLRGVLFNVWEKPYNQTITGHSGYHYPEFKGYYSNCYWATFTGRDQEFTVFSSTEDLFLRLWTPAEPPDPAHTHVTHPSGDISFMRGIPPIGTKFKEPGLLGPLSRPYRFMARRVRDGHLSLDLTFDFRQPD